MNNPHQPLAMRVRPSSLDELIGQDHLLSNQGLFQRIIETNQLFSMIFYGPSGTGKTSAAMILVDMLQIPYGFFNAATNNKKQLEQLINIASTANRYVLIMDEAHRLNKDKQDYLLPYLEDGTIILLGATTANPYYAINNAIRSRVHLVEFKPLSNEAMLKVLKQALKNPKGLDNQVEVDDEVLSHLINKSNGDVRIALNNLEIITSLSKDKHITINQLEHFKFNVATSAFKDDDGFYDLLSGFQKSIRGSDVDAALYYLAKLIQLGDLEIIIRRLLVTAYEDIGLANPAAVSRVVQATDTALKVGFPEAKMPLSVAVIELAASPKSKSANHAIDEALNLVEDRSHLIPAYLRLSPVNLSEAQSYPYDRPDLWPYIGYLPQSLKDVRFYKPTSLSPYEKVIHDNVTKLKAVKKSYDLSKLKQK